MNKNLKREINWGVFYKSVFSLVIPMALQNLINVGVTATDVIMLGRVGETSLSGASLGGQIQFIMVLFLFGLTSGATVLTAQYWGKKDIRAIEKILGMTVKAALIITFVFTVLALAIPATLMRIYTSDPKVIAEGVKYLRIVGLSYMLTGITQAYLFVMRSVERVVISTFVYFCSLVCNIIVNAVLIFGMFGAPRLGTAGAAIGTLCARILELVIVFIYAAKFNDEIKMRMKYILKTDGVLFGDFMKYAIPVMINEMMWGLGTSANTAILGHLGTPVIAANSVVQVARQLAMVVSFGLSSAAAIYLGRTIGEKKTEHAKLYASRFLWMSVGMGVLGMVFVLSSVPVLVHTLVLSEAAVDYLKFMFYIMSYYIICQAWNTVMIVGIFRSGGDTKFGLFVDVSTMWGFSIILGFAAAFIFKLPPKIVYVLLMSDEVAKVFLTWFRYKSYKWLKDVTRNFG